MVAYNLNEKYIGNSEEVILISDFLSNLRHSNIDSSNLSLKSILYSELVDKNLFLDLSNLMIDIVKRYSPNFFTIEEDRYIVKQPDDIGGFYGIPTGGYLHVDHIGYTSMLNQTIVTSKILRTVELCRNYLHDSFHAFSFKTYRWDSKNQVPYRFQYGINFRDVNGVSYSAPNLSNKSPLGINLNVLMDGVIQIYVSMFINEKFPKIIKCSNEKENHVLKELFQSEITEYGFLEPLVFYNTVINPTKLFLNFWGKDKLIDIVIQTMLDGELSRIKNYFNVKLGIADGWEIMFKQNRFQESID